MRKLVKFIRESSWTIRLLLVLGIAMCAYPLVSSVHEGMIQNNVLSTYTKKIKKSNKVDIEKQIELAHKYNDALFQTTRASVGDFDTDILSDDSYENILNISGKGVMGSIEIPKISVNLPIYHGTSDEVLSNGVGHVQTSSFPVGGKNTRTLLTGHRGLPNAKLFTRLDEIKKDDLFYIKVGNKTLAYQVYKIEVIKPDEVDKLDIEEGKDLATLITCTPYGINNKRLIITGKRVPYSPKKKAKIKPEMMSWRELAFTALPFILVGIVILRYFINKRKERKLQS